MKYVAVIESEELNGFSGFSEDTPVINVHRNSYMKQIKFVPYQSIETLLALVGKERQTGHWKRSKSVDNHEYLNCSKCGQHWSIPQDACVFNYCFNCGADMRGAEND